MLAVELSTMSAAMRAFALGEGELYSVKRRVPAFQIQTADSARLSADAPRWPPDGDQAAMGAGCRPFSAETHLMCDGSASLDLRRRRAAGTYNRDWL